ncbi:GLPGLI family protein [Chryseobacterium daeguense]|uniref:GLPGLI family protein n=1 Tax=Chryseobacterium daeguense TaxID=412438 RepID=UPI00041E9B5B|nr:GLPGLI family protein [Chryseobacterium daeguense]
MKKYLFIFLISFFGILSSQKTIHIQYLNVRSPIANVYEDLYTDGVNVLSKQDGNIMFSDGSGKSKVHKDFYFISKISSENKNRDFFYTQYIDNADDYFIHDNVPNIKWSIDYKITKKILGYECIKATAIFRGSPITAYFTEEIPYSVGPFKFYGLPGAILDVRVDGKNYDLWKAIKVDYDNKTKIDYNPQFDNFTKIQMKDYIKLKDDKAASYMNKAQVAGSTGKIVSLRFGVEKTFEWENESYAK